MRLGAGAGKTRGDHLEIAAQLYALVAQARRVADLAEVVGADALGEQDRRYLALGGAFETGFVAQGQDELRPLEATLERAWALASSLPRRELTMVSDESAAAYYVPGEERDEAAAR